MAVPTTRLSKGSARVQGERHRQFLISTSVVDGRHMTSAFRRDFRHPPLSQNTSETFGTVFIARTAVVVGVGRRFISIVRRTNDIMFQTKYQFKTISVVLCNIVFV